MPTLSVDLAYKDYRDLGVVEIARVGARVQANIAGLAGLALENGNPAGVDIAGIAPVQVT